MKAETLQKILPVSALGISIVIHFCIFMFVSGFVLIEACNPPQAFLAESLQPANTVSDLPPEPQPDSDPTPTPANQEPVAQDMTPPVPLTTPNVDIITSTTPVSTPDFSIPLAPAETALTNTQEQTQQPAKQKDNPNAITKRAMATLFGNTGVAKSGALVGFLYDLKQTRERKPTPIVGTKSAMDGNTPYRDVIRKFIANGWNENTLKEQYFRCRRPLSIYQFFVPVSKSKLAPEAFKVESDMEPSHWLAVYHGTITPPASGKYRLAGSGDSVLIVKLGNELLLDASNITPVIPGYKKQSGQLCGTVLHFTNYVYLSKDKSYPVQVIMGQESGQTFNSCLVVQNEKGQYKPSPRNKSPILPVLQFGPTEIPKYLAQDSLSGQEDNAESSAGKRVTGVFERLGRAPHVADDGLVFTASENDVTLDPGGK